jgi:hypothetical protein
MKAIIDAVNELRGDLNNVAYIKSDETYHCNLNYNDDSGWWCSRGFYGDFVCTIDDFQAKANGMPFYYDRWDIGSIEDYLAADKTPLQLELIDGEAYQFDYNNGSMGMQNALMRYNKSGDYFYFDNTVFKARYCSNIQLLTVGDK